MNALNDYVQKNNLPSEMAQRLRDFFHRTKHMWTTEVLRNARLTITVAPVPYRTAQLCGLTLVRSWVCVPRCRTPEEFC